MWEGDNWIAGERLTLGYHLGMNDFKLSGVISPQFQLAVIYTGIAQADGAQLLMAAFGQNEAIGGPVVESPFEQAVTEGDAEVPVATEEAPPSLKDSVDPTPLPTATFSTVVERTNEISAWMGLIAGAVVGGVVVSIVFLRKMLRGKH